DIDSPADLCVLALVGGAGTRLQALLEAQQFDLSRYQRLLPLLTDRNAQLLLAGRVGSKAWAYLEQETACRVRLFSEERGMVADGRLAAAQARSLLGFFLERTGVEDFFQVLPQLCDAAVIDTRVLLAHLESAASRQDRFLSDLSVWEEIEDEFLREFTRLACAAEVPVLLGGHSLLAGGLLSLIEFAWKQREADGAA
ncbi:MAG TPA: hypothetical protein VNL15_04725, partial [Dehalococcoidia bacterium]|nr:hypothetical protein [Dehalococcoidia bacterium]